MRFIMAHKTIRRRIMWSRIQIIYCEASIFIQMRLHERIRGYISKIIHKKREGEEINKIHGTRIITLCRVRAFGSALPAAPASSQYHGCKASGISARIRVASGIRATPYRLMARQSPCVIPSREWMTIGGSPGSVRTKQRTQWR